VFLDTPVTDSLRAWTAWPDVLADFHQRGEGGVWTRHRDILPGRQVRVAPIIAAWGEMTWEAAPADHPGDPTWVWLTPVTEPAQVRRPRQAHDPERLIAAVIDDLRTVLGDRDDWQEIEAILVRALRQRIQAVLADFSATVSLLLQEVRRDRSVATMLLGALADLPAPLRQQLLRSPAASLVYRLARRGRPPRRTAG
jgi:hypothetical protein